MMRDNETENEQHRYECDVCGEERDDREGEPHVDPPSADDGLSTVRCPACQQRFEAAHPDVPDPPHFVTILDVVEARGAERRPDGTINGAEFERLGFALIGGCATCGATIAAYNACPTRCGYWRCLDCADSVGDGFATVDEFGEWEAEEGARDAEQIAADPYADVDACEVDSAGVPLQIKEAIRLYVTKRVEPGSFTRAVLENDLLGATCRADPLSARCLRAIVLYVHNDVEPGWCHGSREAVARWLDGATEPQRE